MSPASIPLEVPGSPYEIQITQESDRHREKIFTVKVISDGDPQSCLDQLTQELIRFIRKTILPSLHERKIYNVVEDDFVMGNSAYEEIFRATTNYKKIEDDAISQTAYIVRVCSHKQRYAIIREWN